MLAHSKIVKRDLMFTGLIQQVGSLVRRETAGGLRLVIAADSWTPPLAIGESVAVNGVCLTVAGLQERTFTCDVLRETLDRTSLGARQPGGALNLERALRMGDPLGGHMMTGHVDGTGTLVQKRAVGRDWVLTITCAGALLRGMVLKGSIAVDGISLTIAGLDSRSFSVHIIPLTWNQTNLSQLRVGDVMNLETDIIGKHVRRRLEADQSGSALTMDRLRQAGFG